MLQFATDLSLLYTELPFLDRFEAAARGGFEAVEFQFPYAHDAEVIAARARAAGVSIVLHNLPAGDWEAGERGIACLPNRVDAFRDGVAQGIACASVLGVTQLNCLAGIVPDGVDIDEAWRTLRDNLLWAAPRLAANGMRLLLEPVNGSDNPRFLVQRIAQAIELLDVIAQPNVLLLYDTYHMQRMEGELTSTIGKLLPRIGHLHLADHPGRHEPGSGEINFAFLLAQIDRLGYAGWIGCAYHPLTTTASSLRWLRGTGHEKAPPANEEIVS